MFRFFSFVTGVILAIAILFLAGTVSARYFMTRLTELPPRPVFSEEQQATASPPEATEPVESPDATEPTSEPPVAEATPPPSDLEAGAYEARVTQPIGLVLREGPSQETTRIGGVDYDDQLIVLGESTDGDWLNVRLPGSGVEGWVKSGNTEAINPSDSAAPE
ncbi:MAG: SH3 domain-containing protein [Synechococcales bacterium]|nr:SH3 domain-containing protein [Synechococcales bacterium]